MHGVKRTAAPSASAKAARKEKEAAKLHTYLAAEEKFFSMKERDQLDEEALKSTTGLLTLNPELYTVWNYRRRVIDRMTETATASTENKADFFASLRKQPASSPSQQEAEAGPSSPKKESDSDFRAQVFVKTRLLEDDLELTQHALKVHPKVYWIWNHRKWCLIEMPVEEADVDSSDIEKRELKEAKWRREVGLVDKMLELDPRNFHGWDYRRYLLSEIAKASIPDEKNVSLYPPFPFSLSDTTHLPLKIKEHHLSLARSEVKYTLRKIEANFSNFSAWHWRSKLLPGIWKAEGKSDEEQAVQRDEEFELLRQAMYTDPDDQSVWLYHAWLVSLCPSREVLQREIQSIEELLEAEPDSKWCIDSLARYKAELARQTGDANQRKEAKKLLERLIEIDPDRKGKYETLLSAQEAVA